MPDDDDDYMLRNVNGDNDDDDDDNDDHDFTINSHIWNEFSFGKTLLENWKWWWVFFSLLFFTAMK